MRSTQIRLSATALREADAITRHLRQEAGSSVERRFALELERTLDLLTTSPDIGRMTSRTHIHVLMLSRFPYHVIYRIVGPNELIVLRIRHAHRRPLTWL